MHTRRLSALLAAILLTISLLSAASAAADTSWFLDYFNFEARFYIKDSKALPLYQELMEAACADSEDCDMAVFMDGFLALSAAKQERMLSGAKVRTLFTALEVWEPFVVAAHDRLVEVRQLPELRALIAPEKPSLLSGKEVWTTDALRLYYGDVGEMGDWRFEPADPQPGAFLFVNENGKVLDDLVMNIERLSRGRLRRTYNPDKASAIVVYSTNSSQRGTYPAYDTKVPAYAATARLKASPLAPTEEAPIYVSLTNEPPAQADLDAGQRAYFTQMPSFVDSEQLDSMVALLVNWMEVGTLATAHP